MKTIKLFLTLAVVAGLSSCSKDDDSSSTNGNIAARWNPVKTLVEVGSSDIEQNYEDNEQGCPKDYIEFASANVLNRAVYNRNVNTNDCEAVNGTPANWAKDENILTINGGQYNGSYEITRLTGSELRIASENMSGGITTTTTIFFTKASN